MSNEFERVILVGPDGNKGGMAMVIRNYLTFYGGFSFLPTYPQKSKRSKIIFFLKNIFRFHLILSKNKNIRIVHIHVASNGSFWRKSIILLISKIHKRKTIFHMHGGSFKSFLNKSFLHSFVIKIILNVPDVILCLSYEWLLFYKSIHAKKRVEIIGNPVDDFSNYHTKTDMKKTVLLFLGKIVKEKGIYLLLETLTANQYFIDGYIKLLIAGQEEGQILQHIISGSKLTDHVKFLGWIDGEKKKEIIGESDIFILPSYHEGLPVSILECMSAGKAIISTHVGGIPSIVENGYNGWTFDPGDKKRLNEIINEAVEKKNMVRQYGIHSKEAVKPYLSNNIKKDLDNLYKSI